MVQRIKTMRHGLAVRIVHWAIVFEAVFLMITGAQLNGLLPFVSWDLYSYHIIVGFMFIGTAFIFLYVVIAAHDWKWFAPRRIPYSVKYIFEEAGAWFRIKPKVQETIEFDVATGEYVEKLIPSVIVVWWAYALMGAVLAFTGLAAAFPASFGFVYAVTNPIGLSLTGVGGLSFVLAVHRLVVVLLICTVAMHLYASAIYRVVSSMFTGYRDEPEVSSTGIPPGLPPVRPAVALASAPEDHKLLE